MNAIVCQSGFLIEKLTLKKFVDLFSEYFQWFVGMCTDLGSLQFFLWNISEISVQTYGGVGQGCVWSEVGLGGTGQGQAGLAGLRVECGQVE